MKEYNEKLQILHGMLDILYVLPISEVEFPDIFFEDVDHTIDHLKQEIIALGEEIGEDGVAAIDSLYQQYEGVKAS